MTDYSYAQLEQLWINAGGPASQAPIAAAIALAESQGNANALNPNDNGGRQSSFGLWQISNGTHTPPAANWADPAENARLAVAKWKAGSPPGTGPNFRPWGTFTSGAYKANLSNKTTPDPNVPPNPSAVQAQVGASGSADCLVPNPLGVSLGPFSLGAGPSCLFSRSNARAFIGAGLMLAGGAVGFAALAVLAVAAGMRAAGPVGKVAEGVGGTLQLIPATAPAGAAIGTAGRTVRSPAREGRRRQAGRARQENADRRRLGEPRENPGLEARGGAVRQDRRQQAAQRSRSRRAATADEPPF